MVVPLTPAYAAPDAPYQVRTEENLTPLAVTLTSIEPAVVPKKGPITITGIVTNRSAETWREVSVYPFASTTPITTRTAMEAAMETSEGTVVGRRFFGPGRAVARIGDLEVGKTAGFQLVLPRRIVPIPTDSAGVYWIGAHALGTNASGSDTLSDGRARTFITQAAPDTARARVSLVLPVRANADRTPEGQVTATKRWNKLLSPSGRLGRINGLLSTARAQSFNLLLDPNVLDVVDNLAAGNPAAELGGGETAKTSKASETLATPADDTASDWLDQLKQIAHQQSVLNLPYADPDAVAVTRTRGDVLSSAQKLSEKSVEEHDLSGTPALATGLDGFETELLDKVDDAVVLVDAARTDAELDATDYSTAGQAHLVFTDTQLGQGGPAGGSSPSNGHDALGLRQLTLATAYLHRTDDESGARPLVVNLPRLWDPGAFWKSANFFSGLQQPWLRLVDVPTSNRQKFDGELEYSAENEVPRANVDQARKGLDRARTLGDLLTAKNNAEVVFSGAALAATAYDAREHPHLARKDAAEVNAWVTSQLARVTITGSDFVTLSGGSGPVSVSIVNGLDHPIEVAIKPTNASDRIRVKVPDPVRLEPKQRSSVKVQINTDTVGVQQIALAPATVEGRTLGEPFTFNLRTSQVGMLIWVIMFAGAVLLAVMIVRRIIRRIRTRSWRLDDEAEEGHDVHEL
jgi:hypothetical protein